MRDAPIVSEVHFHPAPPDVRASGQLGWVNVVVYETVHIDAIKLRRTRDGRLALSFPTRKDDGGRSHSVVRPWDDSARREIEREVIDELRRMGYLP